jgi:hypothetical protein
MRYRFGAALAAIMLTVSGVAVAQPGPLEVYRARLSARDHFNSQGVRLTSPAAIIRQDRANFHRYGLRDPEDGNDSFFAVASNRDALERFLERGTMSPAARNAIINGTPVIFVEVYPDHVNVWVLDLTGRY